MTPLEKDVEKALTRAVGRAGGMCLKWVSPGFSGVPDRICLLPGGRICFIELKRPKGGVVAPLQMAMIRRIRSLGFDARIIHTQDEILDFIKDYGGRQK